MSWALHSQRSAHYIAHVVGAKITQPAFVHSITSTQPVHSLLSLVKVYIEITSAM